MDKPMVQADNPRPTRHQQKCTAHSTRTKELCNRWAMRGQTVCMMHGGKAPQAMAKAETMVELAELRLRNLAPRAVSELESLVTNATSEAVRLGAANSLVDRSLGKATERIHVAASITVTRPW